METFPESEISAQLSIHHESLNYNLQWLLSEDWDGKGKKTHKVVSSQF